MTQSETWCKMTVKKMQNRHKIFHLKLLLSWNSTRVAKKVCVASHNNHPTSLASSWDISFLKSLVQQDPKGSNKVAHLFILDVYVSPNRKYVNLSIIYYIADFSFFMSQDDAYFHIHQNDPTVQLHFHSFRCIANSHDNAHCCQEAFTYYLKFDQCDNTCTQEHT